MITDFVLVEDAYAHKDDRSARPVIEFEPPRRIHADLWIGKLDYRLCEAILDACAPQGENFRPIRQGGCSYAFYRENAPGEHFDTDSSLFRCVALSRLVHPTSVGFTAAARIRQYTSGHREIIPIAISYWNPRAFVMAANNNWLIPDDLPVLHDLLDAVQAGPLTRRLESALWHHEAAARHYFIDLRWPLLITCLEALVKVKDETLPSAGRRFAGSTKVFVDRLFAIGALDASLAVPEAELREMYGQRSMLTHGLAYGALSDATKATYSSLERLARAVIRKALLEPDFREIFATDANIAARLPLRPSA